MKTVKNILSIVALILLSSTSAHALAVYNFEGGTPYDLQCFAWGYLDGYTTAYDFEPGETTIGGIAFSGTMSFVGITDLNEVTAGISLDWQYTVDVYAYYYDTDGIYRNELVTTIMDAGIANVANSTWYNPMFGWTDAYSYDLDGDFSNNLESATGAGLYVNGADEWGPLCALYFKFDPTNSSGWGLVESFNKTSLSIPEPAAIPEPVTTALIGFGLIGLVRTRQHRKKRQ